MRRKGWSEDEVAQLILPYMPPAAFYPEANPEPAGQRGISVPARVSTVWLDQHLPGMDRRQIRLVVDELERRGWSTTDVTVAVLPHLLPKLPPEDRDAVLAGLKELGMTDSELARLPSKG